MKYKNKPIQGISASSGYVIAPAYVINKRKAHVVKRVISKDHVDQEIRRFHFALEKTRRDIVDIRDQVEKRVGVRSAEIFNAHLLILEDPMLISDVEKKVRSKKINCEYAFYQLLDVYCQNLSAIDDPYIRERFNDIEDVGQRVLQNLTGDHDKDWHPFREDVVLVAKDLLPSDAALMHKDNIVGFVTDAGSKTSHTAIMARSLEVPAVVGAKIATEHISSGDMVIIDGVKGRVIVNPEDEVLVEYRKKEQAYRTFSRELEALRDLPAITQDGCEVLLQANIEMAEDVFAAINHGARGIGLFRTEFLYMNRDTLPDEDEHVHVYKKVLEAVGSDIVVVRTLDVGGDKLTPQLHIPKEENPALGWRGIRYCLGCEDVFKVQLRALLRTGLYGNLKIMFPMIAGIEELRAAKKILESVKEELRRDHVAFHEQLPVGIMIETPAAAMIADILAQEVDFFSIGTNDLIQYSLAVDRGNEKTAEYYDPLHPALVRFLKNIVEAGHRHGIAVGMCGEMSSDPLYTEILLALGLDSLSMSHSVVPEVKRVIRALSKARSEELMTKALVCKTGDELRRYADKRLHKVLAKIGTSVTVRSSA